LFTRLVFHPDGHFGYDVNNTLSKKVKLMEIGRNFSLGNVRPTNDLSLSFIGDQSGGLDQLKNLLSNLTSKKDKQISLSPKASFGEPVSQPSQDNPVSEFLGGGQASTPKPKYDGSDGGPVICTRTPTYDGTDGGPVICTRTPTYDGTDGGPVICTRTPTYDGTDGGPVICTRTPSDGGQVGPKPGVIEAGPGDLHGGGREEWRRRVPGGGDNIPTVA
jgi:hypothetical protein